MAGQGRAGQEGAGKNPGNVDREKEGIWIAQNNRMGFFLPLVVIDFLSQTHTLPPSLTHARSFCRSLAENTHTHTLSFFCFSLFSVFRVRLVGKRADGYETMGLWVFGQSGVGLFSP
jgi:hypothetical protein